MLDKIRQDTLHRFKGEPVMTFSTSAKPLGAYTSRNDVCLDLEESYGSRFERMERHHKLIFRAALANYLAVRPYWLDSPHPEEITCMECCIESAGVDAGIWDKENDELTDFIEDCAKLSDDDIEGLIQFLTEVIR